MQHQEPQTQVSHSTSTVSSDDEDLARHGRKEKEKETSRLYKCNMEIVERSWWIPEEDGMSLIDVFGAADSCFGKGVQDRP